MNQIAEHRNAAQPWAGVERALHDAVREASRIDRRLQRVVREKPLAMAFAALAVGFLLGRLVRRF